MNEISSLKLIYAIIPQVISFQGDAILRLVKPGMYANTRALRKSRRTRGISSVCPPVAGQQIESPVKEIDEQEQEKTRNN